MRNKEELRKKKGTIGVKKNDVSWEGEKYHFSESGGDILFIVFGPNIDPVLSCARWVKMSSFWNIPPVVWQACVVHYVKSALWMKIRVNAHSKIANLRYCKICSCTAAVYISLEIHVCMLQKVGFGYEKIVCQKFTFAGKEDLCCKNSTCVFHWADTLIKI